MVRLNDFLDEEDSSASTLNENNSDPSNDYFERDTAMTRSTSTNWPGTKSSVSIIYPCYICNYETYRSTSLVAHLRQHRQGNFTFEAERFQIGKFMCRKCNFKTRWLSSLKEHEQKVHFNNNNNFNYTNSTVNNSSKFKEGPYYCRNCGYKAEKLETIGIHMRRHFTSDIVLGKILRKYPCSLCEYTSRQLAELQDHFTTFHCGINDEERRTITGTNSNVCNKFDDEDNLPQYPCDYCSHRSPSIHLWRDHMETHGGVLEISLSSVQ